MAGPHAGGLAGTGADGRTYDRLADLPVTVDSWSLETHERGTSAGWTRRTTVVALEGAGHVGRGEDVTYDADEHAALLDDPPDLGLAGERTLDGAATVLDGVTLFPAGPPERDAFLDYRRWAVEGALLDLALRQAGLPLAGALDRRAEPVRFVVSPRLGDPPTADAVDAWLDLDPSLAFKLDATAPWPDDLLDALVATGRVRTVDLKAWYPPGAGEDEDWQGRRDPDPAFYRRLLEAFPDAVFEDPAVTGATRPVLEPVADRLAWDAPLHAVADLEALPLSVGWANVKPSRFGTLARLFDFLDHAMAAGLQLYGGGQFELSVGRGQLHDLASLYYPDGPNDVAPRPYNDPEPRAGLPSSPLEPPEPEPGFGWGGD